MKKLLGIQNKDYVTFQYHITSTTVHSNVTLRKTCLTLGLES